MPDTSLIPPDMQLAESTPKPNRRKALWYGALFAAVQISSLVFPFCTMLIRKVARPAIVFAQLE